MVQVQARRARARGHPVRAVCDRILSALGPGRSALHGTARQHRRLGRPHLQGGLRRWAMQLLSVSLQKGNAEKYRKSGLVISCEQPEGVKHEAGMDVPVLADPE